MVPVQVLEQNIKWKAAVMQTTLHSAGTAVLPHKKPLMKVITALFDAPSKVGADNSTWSLSAPTSLNRWLQAWQCALCVLWSGAGPAFAIQSTPV